MTTIKIEHEVSSCYACSKSSNTSRDHDDPFTSAPHPCIWYCCEHGGPSVIMDTKIIDPKCPILKNKAKEI